MILKLILIVLISASYHQRNFTTIYIFAMFPFSLLPPNQHQTKHFLFSTGLPAFWPAVCGPAERNLGARRPLRWSLRTPCGSSRGAGNGRNSQARSPASPIGPPSPRSWPSFASTRPPSRPRRGVRRTDSCSPGGARTRAQVISRDRTPLPGASDPWLFRAQRDSPIP